MEVDGTPKIVFSGRALLLDFDIYNPNELDIVIYLHDKSSTNGIIADSGYKWLMVVPAGVSGPPIQYGISGKSWDAGLWFQRNIIAVAKTAAGADPASALTINIRADKQ